MTGDRTDRFFGGDLSPAEARELAQASVESPELFEDLADVAIAKAALQSGTLPSERMVRFPRKVWVFIAATVAASVLIAFLVQRSPRPQLKPTLEFSAGQDQPVLLAAGLQPVDRNRAPVFRGGEEDRRAPQTTGSIVSNESGLVTIDLGSVDGLSEDSELQVFHDEHVIDRLKIRTVFRNRARGRLVEGKAQLKDRVRVDDAAHLDALVEQIDALYNGGDADAAYKMAEQINWVETAHVRKDQLAAWWNTSAVLRILHGDYQGAEALLNRAADTTAQNDPTYAMRLNNLGVLAELRGDRQKAKSWYAEAVRVALACSRPPEEAIRSAQANLGRLRGSH